MRYRYDALGQRTARTTPTGANNYFRHYDPETARFAGPDPLGLGPAPNPVVYVINPGRRHLGRARPLSGARPWRTGAGRYRHSHP
jgi:RHS repeat-associated protein